ncbi:MAG TPA: ribonuclease J [Actinobacteria bacterium]|nr:ribonuclease J [Actinomycetota bacterium]
MGRHGAPDRGAPRRAGGRVTVRITFLGGLGEIGRNCATIEIDGRLAMIDAGLMFPEEDMLGVDLILPDFGSVVERADDLEAILLTHGHEDHIGALGFLLREVRAPIFGTPLTLALARARIEEAGITAEMHEVEPRTWVEAGPFRFTFIPVTHSIPQAGGIAIETPEGIVLHSGDFKLDPTPLDRRTADLQTFAGFGRRGVRLLLADSTNAERPGVVPSETSVGPELRALVAGAEGRVIVACFASHVHRVQQAIDAVVADGRKFAFLGRSMLRVSEIAARLGLLDTHAGHLVELDDLLELPPERTAVISTGSQGEPFAALSLMAAGEHRSLKLEPGDTVIISATPIPGNETKVSRVINNLIRQGVRVFHGRNAPIHVSGHAAADELLTFYNVVEPKALVPVHGEYSHLVANAALGERVGIEEIVVCEDGDAVVLEDGELRVERKAVSGSYVYVDGSGVGDLEGVIRDRRHLADGGVVIVTVGVDQRTGEIVIGPEVDSHGLTGEPDDLHDLVVERVRQGVERLERPIDMDALRRRIRNSATRALRGRLRRRPFVVPVAIEV